MEGREYDSSVATDEDGEITVFQSDGVAWIGGYWFEPCPVCHTLNINYMHAGFMNHYLAVTCQNCGLRTPPEWTIEDCHVDWKRGVVDRKSLMLAVRKIYPVYDGT